MSWGSGERITLTHRVSRVRLQRRWNVQLQQTNRTSIGDGQAAINYVTINGHNVSTHNATMTIEHALMRMRGEGVGVYQAVSL
jgi:hypothetical protein